MAKEEHAVVNNRNRVFGGVMILALVPIFWEMLDGLQWVGGVVIFLIGLYLLLKKDDEE